MVLVLYISQTKESPPVLRLTKWISIDKMQIICQQLQSDTCAQIPNVSSFWSCLIPHKAGVSWEDSSLCNGYLWFLFPPYWQLRSPKSYLHLYSVIEHQPWLRLVPFSLIKSPYLMSMTVILSFHQLTSLEPATCYQIAAICLCLPACQEDCFQSHQVGSSVSWEQR